MEEEKYPLLSLVDNSTGEVIDEYYSGDRLRIRREEQQRYLENYVINFNQEKSFIKLYDDSIILLEKYLPAPEFKFAICLARHVSYKDCIIRETQNSNSRILNIHDIADIHGYNYNYARKFMSLLKQKGIVGKHETGSILENYDKRYGTIYTVNPFVYFRGSDVLTPVHSFYLNSGWRELLAKDDKP